MSSYTIHQQPELLQPAYNDLMFVVSSSNKTQSNFNYLADIYINGSATPIRLKAPANPTYGSGVFNFGRIVESYVNSDIQKTEYGFQQNTNSYSYYYVKFGEEYGPSSGTTQYAGISTTVVKYVWNSVLDFLEFQNYSPNNYLADNNKTLSRSIDRYMELTHDAWLYFISNDTTMYDKAIINAYNSSSVQIRGVEVSNPFTSSGTIANHFLRFGCGANNLNNISSGFITDTLGSGAIITSGTHYWTVQLDGLAASPVYTFYLTTPCNYTTYRLHFLNELGAFESFSFTKVSRKTIDITRNKYKAPYGALSSSTAFGYSKKDRLERPFFTSMKEGLTLKSDWITEDEHDWLQELITSPEIYLDDSTHGLIAVTCTVSKIDVKTVLNDKLFNLSIDLDFSYNRYRQRY